MNEDGLEVLYKGHQRRRKGYTARPQAQGRGQRRLFRLCPTGLILLTAEQSFRFQHRA